jgi:hypothetical protein
MVEPVGKNEAAFANERRDVHGIGRKAHPEGDGVLEANSMIRGTLNG